MSSARTTTTFGRAPSAPMAGALMMARSVSPTAALSRPPIDTSSKVFEERDQVGDFRGRELRLPRMAVLQEDVAERGGPAIVEERLALTDAAERRRVELRL